MYISKRLKELRTANNFSQEKLAELLNVSRQTISSWENERSYPDVHNLIMLCEIYSISLNDLMKGDIEIMKKEGITFIDKYHILSVLENDNINLWEHLKKVEEGILDD